LKETYIKDLKTGDDFIGYFLIKSVGVKNGSNGKAYLDITLGDKTGEITGKKWDVQPDEIAGLEEYKAGDIIKVRALVKEWKGTKQLHVSRIRKTGAEDQIDKNDYFKAAPEDTQDMYDYIYGVAAAITDEDFRKLVTLSLERNKESLLYYPAASKNHHSIYGGLLYHMKRMLQMAQSMVVIYSEVLNPDLLYAGVIMHDMEKIAEMNADKNGTVSDFSLEGMMIGHLILGVVGVDKLAIEIGMSREKAIMLEHMMLSHHYEPEFGSPKRPVFAEAEALHYLDMIDSKMYDFYDATKNVEGGGFSDRVFTLHNRRIYKPTW
jgi:3'-5' exoribonuclease